MSDRKLWWKVGELHREPLQRGQYTHNNHLLGDNKLEVVTVVSEAVMVTNNPESTKKVVIYEDSELNLFVIDLSDFNAILSEPDGELRPRFIFID
jgi:hypothetical protein